jgi:hypothetical protein
MKKTCMLIAIFAILSAAAFSGEPGAPAREAPPDAAQQRIKEALQRKVTFEFVDTPLQEALAFLNTLTKTNMVLDPRLPNKDARITLRVTDMPVDQALSWVLKLADLEWQIRDQAIFVFDPRQERRRDAEARQAENRQPGREGQGQMQNVPRLSVRHADGTVIEADGPILMLPGLGQQILDRALDTAADGLLAYRLGRDIPQGADFNLEKIKALLAQTVPGAKFVLEPELKVIVVTADKPEDLRRAAALMRAFRGDQQRPPFGPRDPREQGDPFARRERPPQPEEQAVRPPQADQGQF